MCSETLLLSASITTTAPPSMTCIVPFRTEPPDPFPPPLSSAIATPELGMTAKSSLPGFLGDMMASGSPLGRKRPTDTSNMPAASPPALLVMHLWSECGESGNRPGVHQRARATGCSTAHFDVRHGNKPRRRYTRTAQRGRGRGRGRRNIARGRKR